MSAIASNAESPPPTKRRKQNSKATRSQKVFPLAKRCNPPRHKQNSKASTSQKASNEDDIRIVKIANYIKESEGKEDEKIWNDYDYLKAEYNLDGDNFIIITSEMKYLSSLLEKEKCIVIRGPKGAGKTHSLLFIMCFYIKSKKPCIVLTPQLMQKEQHVLQYLKYVETKFCK